MAYIRECARANAVRTCDRKMSFEHVWQPVRISRALPPLNARLRITSECGCYRDPVQETCQRCPETSPATRGIQSRVERAALASCSKQEKATCKQSQPDRSTVDEGKVWPGLEQQPVPTGETVPAALFSAQAVPVGK